MSIYFDVLKTESEILQVVWYDSDQILSLPTSYLQMKNIMVETHLLIPDRAGWATQVNLVVNLVAG